MKTTQEIFNLVIESKGYSKVGYMCIALSRAEFNGEITDLEETLAQNEIEGFIQGNRTLANYIGHPEKTDVRIGGDSKYALRVYRDWENRYETVEKIRKELLQESEEINELDNGKLTSLE